MLADANVEKLTSLAQNAAIININLILKQYVSNPVASFSKLFSSLVATEDPPEASLWVDLHYIYDLLGCGRQPSNCWMRWLDSQRFKRFFSPPPLLQQKTLFASSQVMYCFGYTGTFGFGSIGVCWRFVFFPLIARQRGAAIRAGRKIECVDVIFICSAHSLSFCQRIFWCV